MKNQIKANSVWWVYQIHQTYLKQLYLKEITPEQYEKDVKFLKDVVSMKISEDEKITFDEFMKRIFE